MGAIEPDNEDTVKVLICNAHSLQDLKFDVPNESSTSYINALDRIEIHEINSWSGLDEYIKSLYKCEGSAALAIYDIFNLISDAETHAIKELNGLLMTLSNIRYYKHTSVVIADPRAGDNINHPGAVERGYQIDTKFLPILYKWTIQK